MKHDHLQENHSSLNFNIDEYCLSIKMYLVPIYEKYPIQSLYVQLFSLLSLSSHLFRPLTDIGRALYF
jgi:hypothetical protein